MARKEGTTMVVRRRQESLGELELAVLKVLWDQPGSTVLEVAEIMAERRDCARTTILTVMQRLHAKGFLRRKKVQGIHRYSANRERRHVLSGLVGRFVENVLDGSASQLLAYLVEAKDLTPEQAGQLRRIVEEIERSERR
jgi:predicted transcriptional regulator